LFFRTIDENQTPIFVAMSLEAPDTRIVDIPLQSGQHPVVSPDGMKFVPDSFGRFTVNRLNPVEELLSIPLERSTKHGTSDFSPDGRCVVYCSWKGPGATIHHPRLWLIDATTGKVRLLADLYGTMPRWSRDGKTIAVDDRDKNEIVLFDVSRLDLSEGLENAIPIPVTLAPSPSEHPVPPKDPEAP